MVSASKPGRAPIRMRVRMHKELLLFGEIRRLLRRTVARISYSPRGTRAVDPLTGS